MARRARPIKQKTKINGFDLSEFDEMLEKLKRAQKKDLREAMCDWLEILGLDFLDIVQDQIIKTGTVDTRRLLKSFTRGDSDNVFKIQYKGLQLEVGTEVEYAGWVNNGHWTTSPGVEMRWVPGRWHGNKFEYDPGAKTGMLLKRKWVEGKHYWDKAIVIFERMFEKKMNEYLQNWIDEYFG